MTEMVRDTSRKYVGELVWLPAYVVIAIFVLASIKDGLLATGVLLVALITGRMIFEFLSRVLLGNKRLLDSYHIGSGLLYYFKDASIQINKTLSDGRA